ncbi:cytochrome P450 [Pyronema omphalodes]|nr:cytochrome P450 [Pyronema omphalodes]
MSSLQSIPLLIYTIPVSDYIPENRYVRYAALASIASFCYCFVLFVYRLYFHPLAKFPGPFWAKTTQFWLVKTLISGRNAQIIQAAHEKYGPIIRLSPTDLSFATTSSWRDIYGKENGRKQFTKTEWYQMVNSGFGEHGIGSEPDVDKHARKRKLLAPIFSKQAVRDFEKLLIATFDKFTRIVQIEGSKPEGIDMSEWMHKLMYDLMADLAFGEPSGVMDTGGDSYWVNLVNNNINVTAFVEAANRFVKVDFLLKYMVPKIMLAARDEHVARSRAATAKRIEKEAVLKGRSDMISYFLKDSDYKGTTIDEIACHFSQVILGGGGTTATVLTGTLNHLIRQPDLTRRLRQEIVPLFKNSDEILAPALSECTFLTACIREGLRLLLPTPGGMPRMSHGETVDGHYIPAGTIVFSHGYTLSRSEENFKDGKAFHPDRWIDPDNTDNKAASQPFALGPRQCIGQALAWDQMRVILAKMFYLFEMKLINPPENWEDNAETYFTWKTKALPVAVKRRASTENDPIWTRV